MPSVSAAARYVYPALLVTCCFIIIFKLAYNDPRGAPASDVFRPAYSQDRPLGAEVPAHPEAKLPITGVDPDDDAHPEPKEAVLETEVELDHDVKRYTRTRTDLEPDLLWLALTYNNESWGALPDKSPRSIKDMHEIIAAQYDIEFVSLGLLTSSMDEYTEYKESIADLNYAKVTIFFHPGFRDKPAVDRKNRHTHNKEIQTARRSEMAKLRNYLMLKAMGEEEHIIWLDADVWRVDPSLIRRMIQHTRENEDYGILTSLCKFGNGADYDRNAWAGTRQGPRGWDLDDEEIKAGELKRQGQKHVFELIKGTHGNELIELATVGATILYMRASLVSRGVIFPHQYVVGTRWGKDGWDGIESEGVCYMARGLKGGRCGVLGGSWHVSHAA